jgi:bifunctional oligoribonuclease and PAP phosphatase NrnA
MGKAAEANRREMMTHSTLTVPAGRVAQLERIVETLLAVQRVVLTTHVNADGDGAGSQCAMASWLRAHEVEPIIINPTPFPEMFRFLVPPGVAVHDAGSTAAGEAIEGAELLLVLDTGEPKRIGRMAAAASGRRIVVLDHHVGSETAFGGVVLQDASACATGELVFDLFCVHGWQQPWPAPACEAVYTALVTDTGSFRFANTTPRAHAVAGALIAQGVEPEQMYRRIFGTVPLRRIQLLRHALEHLDVDEAWPLSWITLQHGVFNELGATSDDLEGLVEHARSIEGTEVAILFREVQDGSTKVSLRSNGAIDVNAIARTFGGGGHVKASGAVIGAPLDKAQPRVLQAVRDALQHAGLTFRSSRDGA